MPNEERLFIGGPWAGRWVSQDWSEGHTLVVDATDGPHLVDPLSPIEDLLTLPVKKRVTYKPMIWTLSGGGRVCLMVLADMTDEAVLAELLTGYTLPGERRGKNRMRS